MHPSFCIHFNMCGIVDKEFFFFSHGESELLLRIIINKIIK